MTHTHESPGGVFLFCFVYNPEELCWGLCPAPLIRSWIESSGMAQCRCQNQSKAAEFWEDLPNTENFGCTQNGLLDFYICDKGFVLMSCRIQTQTCFSKKVQLCCYIVARVYLHAHLAFQAPIASSELEIVLSELWLQFSFFLLFYPREHTVEWLKSELLLLLMKRNKELSS